MRDGLRIFDADRHVIEPYDLWDRFLDRQFRPYAPRAVPFVAATGLVDIEPGLAAAAARRPMLVVGDKPVCRNMSARTWVEIIKAAESRRFLGPLDRPDTQIAHMDEEGTDVAMLYPTYGLLIEGLDWLEPTFAAALARAYNRWLSDLCSHAPGRLFGAGLVSAHAPKTMAAEVANIAADGLRAVILRPNPVEGRRLSHAAYSEFWSECEARSLAVVIHEASHAYLPSAGADRFTTRFAQHACSHPMEQMIAVLDLIEGGVFDRHPRLRVGFMEAGCGWVPYWLWRLDAEYAHLAAEVSETVRMAPSAYFQRHAFVSAEADEPDLPAVLDLIGAGNGLFGTDFPHVDHDDGLIERALARRSTLSDGQMRKYLWENAVRFFGPP